MAGISSSAVFKRSLLELFLTFVLVFFMSLNFYVNIWISRPLQTDDPIVVLIQKTRKSASRLNSSENETDFDDSVPFGQLPVPLPAPTVPSPQRLWPSLTDFNNDRILAQLKFTPQSPKQKKWVIQKTPLKRILLFHGFKDWDVKRGQQTFIEQKCAVNACTLTDDKRLSSSADAILFKQYPTITHFKRQLNQVWIYFMLEPPSLPIDLKPFRNKFNWTATFRRDSDIVAPYEKFVPHNSATKRKVQNKNYAAGKTKKVAWFVSNCQSTNQRMEYARELSKYIQVDVYGRCSRKKCSRNNHKCKEMLNTDYKFYLAFENSNCRDYITEKFFVTGLQHDVLPVVMGAPKEDYLRAAPHDSFIHVDDFASPRALAAYLHLLDQNDRLYNDYFQWKGTGTFINTYFWCRVCAMLHDESRGSSAYGDLERWWRGNGVCIGRSSWKRYKLLPYISDYYRQFN